jgi:hypothetical protein
MGYKYEHSKTFASLKKIKETIGTNFSSYQYLSTLDSLLYKVIRPLVDNTHFVDHFLAKILAWQYQNPKRKVSSLPRSDLASCVTLFLVATSTDRKMKLLKKIKLDRGVLSEMIRLWLKVCEPYGHLATSVGMDKQAYLYEEQLLEIKASLKQDHSLYGAYQQVNYWWSYYLEFRNRVLEKYVRLCLSQAQKDYVAFKHRVPMEDVIQIYLVNAAKALDKCDTEKGVLTTHITNWLKHAKNQVVASHLSDTAYVLPKNSKTVGTFLAKANTVSLDDVVEGDLTKEDTDAGEVDAIRRISKLFDPRGLGRICLGIEESLSNSEKQILHAHSVRRTPKPVNSQCNSIG